MFDNASGLHSNPNDPFENELRPIVMREAMSQAAKRPRIEEIDADLMAYRLGWVSYDRAHVAELQAERATIIAKEARP